MNSPTIKHKKTHPSNTKYYLGLCSQHSSGEMSTKKKITVIIKNGVAPIQPYCQENEQIRVYLR
jgi:hypothetical protein